jgi:hypothetical protein
MVPVKVVRDLESKFKNQYTRPKKIRSRYPRRLVHRAARSRSLDQLGAAEAFNRHVLEFIRAH